MSKSVTAMDEFAYIKYLMPLAQDKPIEAILKLRDFMLTKVKMLNFTVDQINEAINAE